MALAITTHCATTERLPEVRALAAKNHVPFFFVHTSQVVSSPLLETTNLDATVEGFSEDGQTKPLGIHGLLEDAPSLALLAAESVQQQSAARVREMVTLAASLGGSYLVLGSADSRKLPSRMTTSELHAMLAVFFDRVIPALEARECQLILDVLPPVSEGQSVSCLKRIEDVLRFLHYYRHPLLGLGLRSSAVLQLPENLTDFCDNVLPYAGLVIVDDLQAGAQNTQRLLDLFSRANSRLHICLETPRNMTDPLATLRHLLPQFRTLAGLGERPV